MLQDCPGIHPSSLTGARIPAGWPVRPIFLAAPPVRREIGCHAG
jgi:hypothetical protein